MPKSAANMGAFPGRAHSPGLPPPSSASFPLAPPATHQVPASQKTRHWKNGTEFPALLEVKLHFLFGVNARAGRLTRSAAFFWTCAPRRVTVQSWTTRVAVQATSCHVVKDVLRRQYSPTSLPIERERERGTPNMANIAFSKQLRH